MVSNRKILSFASCSPIPETTLLVFFRCVAEKSNEINET